MKTKLLFSLALLPLCFSSANAAITFEFLNNTTTIGAALDDQPSGSFTVDGLEITATALPGGESFNATASGFGINQSASGDDTDAFNYLEVDGPGVAEGLTVSFDFAVQLNSISVADFGVSDEVQVSYSGGLIATITSTGMTSLDDVQIAADDLVTIMTTAGSYSNGWWLDNLVVTPVPEPHEYAMVAGLALLGFAAFRRRRRVTP